VSERNAPGTGASPGRATGQRTAGSLAAGWTDGRWLAEGIDSALVGLRGRPNGKSVHTAPHPEALQLDDPPTRPGFVTALDDAYLMPREDGYAVFSRASGLDLCTVRPEVAERALRRQGQVVQLGTWSGTLRGRADDWTLWWARGVPWAATSDVAGAEEIPPLIERWQDELARAQAHGHRWEPLPPGVTRPGGARVAARPARRPPRSPSRVLGGLRALLRGI
jgi:hypothetical protein